MLYQWKRCSTALWINRTVHSSFPLCYSPSSREGSHINADVSLFYWLLFEQRDVKVLGRVCCEAYITLFRSAVSLFLFACRGDVTIGTKCLAWVQPFWGTSSCDLVRMCLLSRGNGEGCKPLGLSSCLSTWWMLPIQFSVHKSSDSTLVLDMPGRDGQHGDRANVMMSLWWKEVLQWHNLLSLPRWDWGVVSVSLWTVWAINDLSCIVGCDNSSLCSYPDFLKPEWWHANCVDNGDMSGCHPGVDFILAVPV